jgi:hypothetical protein
MAIGGGIMVQPSRLSTSAAVLAGCLLLPLACFGCGPRNAQNAAPEATAQPGSAEPGQASSAPANRAPQILSQPRSVVTRENDPIVLQVVADATPPPTYQWTKDGVAIAGATGATYRGPTARRSDAGTYQVAVSNAAGSVLSNAVAVAVDPAATPPAVTGPPVDLVVGEATPAVLKVTASGAQPMAYRWTKEGRPRLVSTEAELWIRNSTPEDSGFYTVEVSNALGRTTATCRLTVTPRPR